MECYIIASLQKCKDFDNFPHLAVTDMNQYRDDLGESQHFTDNPQFEEWSDAITKNLFDVNGHLSTLQQFIKTLQSNLKQGNNRSKMIANIDKKSVLHIEKISGALKVVNDLVHKMNSIEETALNKAQLISREKLIRDVKYSVQEFQSAQTEFARISKNMNEEARAALEEDINHGGDVSTNAPSVGAPDQQIVIEREAINNEEFAYQQNLIRQRDEEISNIESGITELNEIFHDLGTIVQQQGHLVDNIESNIYSVVNSTQSAARELGKAMASQRSSSKWCLYMLIILAFFLLMMLLIVFT